MSLPTDIPDEHLEKRAKELAKEKYPRKMWPEGTLDEVRRQRKGYASGKLEDLRLARTVRGYMDHQQFCHFRMDLEHPRVLNERPCSCGYEAAMSELEAFLGIPNTTEG